jgi:diaminohydroxyphosphoribosylaminopyrimidine deaminase/5-amino-6-(5-phosphoribosylamino)uracil reductase
MYVTLEPCCHYGRTPPCTEAILENGIARVVIGSRDPNPLVSGKGAQLLREHGVSVEQDVLREECDALNPVFFHYITTGKPYVVMKYAMTLDGKIASYTGASRWITGAQARAHVHALRGSYSAILAGIGTVLADDPMLNCRLEGAHQPLRIIADSTLRIPPDAQICQSAHKFPTVVAYASGNPEKIHHLEQLGIRTVQAAGADGHVDLRVLMEWLGQQKIDSVLIEGGGILHEAALRAGIVNHVCAYVAPLLLGGANAKTPVEGIGAREPDLGARLGHLTLTQLGEDLLLEYDLTGGMNHVYWNC